MRKLIFIVSTRIILQFVLNSHAAGVDNWRITNHLELDNAHRAKASLRASLNGVTIAKHATTNGKVHLDLSDKTTLEIAENVQVSTSLKNVAEFELIWRGVGPSLDKELCLHYGFNNASWYSTYEEAYQIWPLDTHKHIAKGRAFTTTDYFKEELGDIIEYLFINSDGFGVMLDESHPWFIRRDANNGDALLCFAVSNQEPYPAHLDKNESGYFDIHMRIRAATDIRQLYVSYTDPKTAGAKGPEIKVPRGIPDERILRYPIWSTWAEYKKNVDEKHVLDYAAAIKKHGFPYAQLEIDDQWQTTYGDETHFDAHKFANAKSMISTLHGEGFRVTAWIHPFINKNAHDYEQAKAYAVKDLHGQPITVEWWDGKQAEVLDFSNPATANWFVARMNKLKNDTGLDSFKFDAGELTYFHGKDYVPHDAHVRAVPNLMSSRYVQTVARLGTSIEVRTAFKNQAEPIFVRMLDKYTSWDINNGVKTLVTTALMMSLAGYSFILPDMIGGNAYGNYPDEELFIRWMQANTLLPTMQFSIPPWHYKESTVQLTKKFVDLHASLGNTIVELAKRRVEHGEPIIRPMWWTEPNDVRAARVGDQFMLGNDIVVAPVLEHGQRERQVYLPTGSWVDVHGASHSGPAVIKVAAPLEELPYFRRK